MIPPFSSAFNLMFLAFESQQAAQLRLYHLGMGGSAAIDESLLMVHEKLDAFGAAAGVMMSGGSFDDMVDGYRTIVQANVRRLSRES